ncbi:MAG: nucleoside-triphosphatase [Spirochaetota bacterium]
MTNVLVTGRRGAGKSTVIREALRAFGRPAGGFLTERARCTRGTRVVMRDILTGLQATVAETGPGGTRRVYPRAFEEVGVSALERARLRAEVVVMDELGFLELGSPVFMEAVLSALDGDKPVLAAVRNRRMPRGGKNPFLLQVRSRSTSVYRVTRFNRGRLAARVACALQTAG